MPFAILLSAICAGIRVAQGLSAQIAEWQRHIIQVYAL